MDSKFCNQVWLGEESGKQKGTKKDGICEELEKEEEGVEREDKKFVALPTKNAEKAQKGYWA